MVENVWLWFVFGEYTLESLTIRTTRTKTVALETRKCNVYFRTKMGKSQSKQLVEKYGKCRTVHTHGSCITDLVAVRRGA